MKALGKGSIASIVRVGLQIAWIVLWALAVCLVVVGISYAVVVALVATGVINSAQLQALARWLEEVGGSIHFNISQPGGDTWPVVVAGFLIGGVAIAGSLVIVWRLRKLFESFSSGEPFRRENATHLRVIWITMLAIELSRYLLMALTGVLLTAFGPQNGVGVQRVELTINLSTWGSILILIVLAEVFREGARLKEEQELTI